MTPGDVLKIVRDALEAGHNPGHWSPGGPCDGPGEDPSFDTKRAVDFLNQAILDATKRGDV